MRRFASARLGGTTFTRGGFRLLFSAQIFQLAGNFIPQPLSVIHDFIEPGEEFGESFRGKTGSIGHFPGTR
jgi:hypothetical protein